MIGHLTIDAGEAKVGNFDVFAGPRGDFTQENADVPDMCECVRRIAHSASKEHVYALIGLPESAQVEPCFRSAFFSTQGRRSDRWAWRDFTAALGSTNGSEETIVYDVGLFLRKLAGGLEVPNGRSLGERFDLVRNNGAEPGAFCLDRFLCDDGKLSEGND